MGLLSFVSGAASAIGSFISGVGGAIGSAVSAISGGIAGICSTIGGALSSVVGGIAQSLLASCLAMSLPDIIIAVQIIAIIVSTIAEVFGLKEVDDEENEPKELGMKAEVADKKPEDFDSTVAYIEYLKNEVKIDKEKMNELSDEKKAEYALVGSALYIEALKEKYNVNVSPEYLDTMRRLKQENKLTEKEIAGFVKTFQENGITDMTDMSDYIKGNAPQSGTRPSTVSDAMFETLKKENPDMSENEVAAKFNTLTLDDVVDIVK